MPEIWRCQYGTYIMGMSTPFSSKQNPVCNVKSAQSELPDGWEFCNSISGKHAELTHADCAYLQWMMYAQT